MDAPKGNVKNPAIRRIHADIRELQKDPSDQYHAEPLEENLFEWHFTLRGPPGTDFEGGIYHGRILLPSEYPFKPPNIMLLTPNGRFEVGKKICLSISAHHPEHWQPAWGVRLILEALISFFPTDPKGAVGSLDWTPAERKRLAKESQSWSCPRCGPPAALLPPLKPSEDAGAGAGSGEGANGTQGGATSRPTTPSPYAEEIAQLYVRSASSMEDSAMGAAPPEPSASGDSDGVGDNTEPSASALNPQANANAANTPDSTRASASASAGAQLRQTRAPSSSNPRTGPIPRARTQAPPPQEEEERDVLLYVAMALLVLILALLARKVMRAAQDSA